ncbi:hypothetical protein ACFVAF_04530 [Streptomyces sp. NPDC057596]|uniref:hypothetical protein n=1 Tax=Streptomyces sp. NPDC057596 TaxID=3346178 RepID=UPI003691E4D7
MDTNREGHSDDEFPPLRNEDVADDTGRSGLTVGELAGLSGGLASMVPVLARMPALDLDRLARPLASLIPVLENMPDVDRLSRPLASILPALDVGIPSAQWSRIAQQISTLPALAERLRALDVISIDDVDAPDDALSVLQEPARNFADAEGAGRRWEEQQRLFAGAVAFIVLSAFLQVMVSSDVVKELVEDSSTVGGAVAAAYLMAKKAWAMVNPQPQDDDEETTPPS